MGRDLVVFVPLAVLTNTVLGPPFDPVLLWFTARHPFPEAWTLVLLGSLCAGLGGAVEAAALRLGNGVLGRIAGKAGARAGSGWSPLRRWLERNNQREGGRRGAFYVFAFAVAASPAPFSLVRIAAVSRRPAPVPYALSIAAGRLPRYALLVFAWNWLRPPAWAAAALVGLAVAGALAAWAVQRRPRSGPGGRDLQPSAPTRTCPLVPSRRPVTSTCA